MEWMRVRIIMIAPAVVWANNQHKPTEKNRTLSQVYEVHTCVCAFIRSLVRTHTHTHTETPRTRTIVAHGGGGSRTMLIDQSPRSAVRSYVPTRARARVRRTPRKCTRQYVYSHTRGKTLLHVCASVRLCLSRVHSLFRSYALSIGLCFFFLFPHVASACLCAARRVVFAPGTGASVRFAWS